MSKYKTLTELHQKIQKLVRRWYQENNEGARLFANKSGFGYVGINPKWHGKSLSLENARPIRFGIPDVSEGSGGADLLGVTIVQGYPVITAIEIKTGEARLRKNQRNFRKWIESINGIYLIARDCHYCGGTVCEKCNYRGWYFVTS